MAKSKSEQQFKSKHKQSNLHAESAATKLFLYLACLSIFGLTTLLVIQNLLVTRHQLPNSSVQLDNFNNDLELAKKPFTGQSFPINKIFGQNAIWGTLNSGHYFGFKLSTPDAIETSMLWFENQLNQEGRLNVRHLCDQNDRLESYSWHRHDFSSFGEQIIRDQGYKLETSFIKNPDNHLEWTAKVDIQNKQQDTGNDTSASIKPLSVILYVTKNNPTDQIELHSYRNILRDDTDAPQMFAIRGDSRDIGKFELSARLVSPSVDSLIYGNYLSANMNKLHFPVSSFLQSKMISVVKNGTRLYMLPGSKKVRSYYDEPDDPDDHPQRHNIVAYQMVLKAPCSLFIDLKQSASSDSGLKNDAAKYTETLKEKSQQFDANFSALFPIDYKQVFVRNQLEPELLEKLDMMARVSLSNMLGSVGYFHGHSYISTSSGSHKVEPYGPIQLLSGVPSRSFFPRGFLWDEAFHNLLISEWNPTLSGEIIKSWFDIMNINGWIPREVILGVESMRRVPNEFRVQYITNANPPAMFIVLEKMLDKGTLQQETFEHIYPRLKTWYRWFKMTQAGPSASTYRWRGRDQLSVDMLNPKTLTSGLDDYPRASHPSPAEYHIDLRCWMALAARTLTKFSRKLDDQEFLAEIGQDADQLLNSELLDALHWDSQHDMFCDFGHNNENTQMVKVTKTRLVQPDNRVETYQELERRSVGQPVFGCVPEFGYVSLFPMLFNLLKPNSSKLGILLRRLRDERELWSPYGIRSLSKLSRYYNKHNTEHDKPYWRGAIWMNINYLILASLKFYSKVDGPYQSQCGELFVELRENLARNLLKQFAKTNYLWEHYDDQTGEAKGSHPFTGWSSLILLILSKNFH